MSTVLAELKQKAAQLSENERAELALALIESSITERKTE